MLECLFGYEKVRVLLRESIPFYVDGKKVLLSMLRPYWLDFTLDLSNKFILLLGEIV